MKRVLLLILCLPIYFMQTVYGYDNVVIHPRFAREATNVYNISAYKKLTTEQVTWIVAGSIKEDADPRYMHHFYDYRTGAGLGLFSSASDWTQEQISSLGDFSEDAVIQAYKNGNEQLAYIGVGHQLHLIEDMAVPAHVRNDPHVSDIYENWCQANGRIIASISSLSINDIPSAISELARYTGANFYSADSADGQIKYDKLNTDSAGNEYAIKDGFRLAKINISRNGANFRLNDAVHQDYFNQLAPKAIGYSAGVIDYFQKKFALIDEERKNESKFVAFFKSVVNFLPDLKSDEAIAWGDTVNAQNIKGQLALSESLRNRVMNDEVLRTDINNSMLASQTVKDSEVVKIIETTKDRVEKTKVLGEKISSKLFSSSTESKLTTNITTPETTFEVGEVGDGEEAAPKTTFKIINPANAKELVDVTMPTTFPNFPFTFNGSGGSLNAEPANVEPIVIPEPIIYPETMIVSNPPMLGSSSMAVFVFGSDQASTTYKYLVDVVGTSSMWQVASSSLQLYGLSDGPHLIRVRSVYKGVLDETPTEFSWLVDTTPPASVISPLAPYYNQPTFTIHLGREDFASDQAFYDIEYAVNDKDWLSYLTGTTSTSTVLVEIVNPGDYVHFRIRSCDELGNCEAWPSVEQASTRVGPVVPGVATLSSDSITQNSVVITWLSPTDGHLSDEARYDLRYQKKIGTCNMNATWEMASSASNLPAVAMLSGEAVALTIADLEPGSTYCAALRTYNGFNWSTTSNVLEVRTDCATQTNIMANYSVKLGVANNLYGPPGTIEPVLLVRLMKQGMSYRTFIGSTCAWNGPTFNISLNSVYGSVEFEYSTSTKLFTGRYRSCGNAYSGNYYSKPDINGFCEDRPTWWGNGRWMTVNQLTGQSSISIAEYFPNNTIGGFTQWLGVE